MVKYADRMECVRASDIRELLKVTEKPEMISFAGGLPAPELFPVERLKEVTMSVLESCGAEALQYATTEGFGPLRAKIAERMNKKYGTCLTAKNILIVSGSQQGLDFTGKIFLNEGDVVLCESPTYLGALNAFNVYRPKIIEVPTDNDGMLLDKLEEILESVDRIKLIYTITMQSGSQQLNTKQTDLERADMKQANAMLVNLWPADSKQIDARTGKHNVSKNELCKNSTFGIQFMVINSLCKPGDYIITVSFALWASSSSKTDRTAPKS